MRYYLKIFAIIAYILTITGYLLWRFYDTLNPDQIFASYLFWATDLITGLSCIVFIITFFPKRTKHIRDNEEQGQKYTVDVFIPTYNESIDVLRRTIYRSIAMDYPHKTFVLDDGNRLEVKELAEKLGANYISRKENIHAKAGNLNNAISHTSGDLIAILDADFVPAKSFLNYLVPLFKDQKLALAQTPQYYYNADSIQHKTISSNKEYCDQDVFMHKILPERNKWNAAYWIGTNAMIRREALNSVNGFATESVTEDILTSVRLHDKGWTSVYIDQPLAYGIAPSNAKQYFIQRLRWAKGAVQIFINYNPIYMNGLTLIQKMFYFSSLFHFIEGVFKSFYFIFPALFFCFRVIPIQFSEITITLMLLYYITGLIFIRIIVGKSRLLYDEAYAMVRSVTYLLGLSAIFYGRKVAFIVTPKEVDTNIPIRSIFGPVLFFTFNLAVVISGIINPSIIFYPDYLNTFCFLWSCVNLAISFIAIKICLGPMLQKKEYRNTDISLKIDNISREIKVSSITDTQMIIHSKYDVQKAPHLLFTLVKSTGEEIQIQANVHKQNKNETYYKIEYANEAERYKMIDWLYSY